MKRAMIIFLVAALVLVTSGIWFFTSGQQLNRMDFLHFGIILILVLFALFIGYKRLTSANRGEPAEDELTKKVLQKTAAYSYYISLYIWVAMIYIKDRITFDTEQLLGTGILAMAITFACCWIIFNFRGVRNG
jgi:peptidoglycan/LPS O-acetylase OafA/YrhL